MQPVCRLCVGFWQERNLKGQSPATCEQLVFPGPYFRTRVARVITHAPRQKAGQRNVVVVVGANDL